MPANKLPNPGVLNQLLSDLMNLKIEIVEGESLDPLADAEPMIVSSYQTEDGKIKAVCICDISASNRMGAALTMIPAEMANKNISYQKITQEILDNVQEVMNVVGGFLNTSDLPHLKLKNVILMPNDLEEDVKSILSDPGIRLNLSIELKTYGTGQMNILLGDV